MASGVCPAGSPRGRVLTTLSPGDRAPDFELADDRGVVWRLADLRGRKVIFYFYPKDDTPGCTAQACDFRDAHGKLQRTGYVVLGVSPQGADSHARFARKLSLNFPLLVDADLSVAARYGATKPRAGGGASIKRSTFVIDEEGRIAQALYGVRGKGHVESLLESLPRG